MNLFKKIGWPYWVVGIAMGVVVPLLMKALGLSAVLRFGGLLILVNGGIAIATGRLIVRKQQPRWWLLIWPVWFLVGAMLAWPQYTWAFAVVYLCVAYLTAGLSTPETGQSEIKN